VVQAVEMAVIAVQMLVAVLEAIVSFLPKH
jgi:hypothetical protein